MTLTTRALHAGQQRQAIAARIRRDSVLEYVREYIDQHGWAPTFQEIADGTGFHSKSAIDGHLRRLEGEGKLVLGGGPRMIRLSR